MKPLCRKRKAEQISIALLNQHPEKKSFHFEKGQIETSNTL